MVSLLLISKLSWLVLCPLCILIIRLPGIFVEIVVVVIILLSPLPLLVCLLSLLTLRRVCICAFSVAIELLALASHTCILTLIEVFPSSSVVFVLCFLAWQYVVSFCYLFESVFIAFRAFTFYSIWVMLFRKRIVYFFYLLSLSVSFDSKNLVVVYIFGEWYGCGERLCIDCVEGSLSFLEILKSYRCTKKIEHRVCEKSPLSD